MKHEENKDYSVLFFRFYFIFNVTCFFFYEWLGLYIMRFLLKPYWDIFIGIAIGPGQMNTRKKYPRWVGKTSLLWIWAW